MEQLSWIYDGILTFLLRAIRDLISNIPNITFFINIIVCDGFIRKKEWDAKSKLPIVTWCAAFFLIGCKNVPGSLPQRSRVREILSFLSISPCREWQHPVGISRPNFTIFRYRASHSNSPRKKRIRVGISFSFSLSSLWCATILRPYNDCRNYTWS